MFNAWTTSSSVSLQVLLSDELGKRAPGILDDVVVPAEYTRINDGTGPSVQGERESAMDMVGPLGQCGDLAERSMARNSQIFPGSVWRGERSCSQRERWLVIGGGGGGGYDVVPQLVEKQRL